MAKEGLLIVPMTSSSFCSHCGADLPPQEVYCGVCGHFVQVSDLSQVSDPSYDPVIPPLVYRAQTSTARSTLLGRYRLLEKIGEGGYGLVYKAVDRKKGRLVAIKEISLAGLSAKEMIEVTDTFNREISILSNLEHKHLPRLYAHFTDPQHWYVVMEYLEGKTLEELLSLYSGGRIPVEGVLTIGEQLCDVLDCLHVQSPPIVYRDVKPGNIIITDKGDLYLVDFGTARRYQEGKQKDTEPLGSPGYAAPEQYGKAQTTPQTDIYGLGATLQTLLTGKEPLDIQIEGVPPDCEIPERLQMLLKRMMAKDPHLRPENMKKVRKQLQGIREEMAEMKGKTFHPFAWVMVVWSLLMGTLYYAIYDVIWFPWLWPLWLPFLLIYIIGISAYQLIKLQRRFSHKLTVKEVFIALNKGSARSWLPLFYGMWVSFYGSIGFYLPNSIVFLGVFIGGLLAIYLLPQLLRWLKRQKTMRQKQQSPPVQVLQQQKHP